MLCTVYLCKRGLQNCRSHKLSIFGHFVPSPQQGGWTHFFGAMTKDKSIQLVSPKPLLEKQKKLTKRRQYVRKERADGSTEPLTRGRRSALVGFVQDKTKRQSIHCKRSTGLMSKCAKLYENSGCPILCLIGPTRGVKSTRFKAFATREFRSLLADKKLMGKFKRICDRAKIIYEREAEPDPLENTTESVETDVEIGENHESENDRASQDDAATDSE